jgi:hypothetical protein
MMKKKKNFEHPLPLEMRLLLLPGTYSLPAPCVSLLLPRLSAAPETAFDAH